MRAILIFHNCEGKSHKTMSTDHNFWRERRAEADSNRGPSAYQPNVLLLGQTDSLPVPCHPCTLQYLGLLSLPHSCYYEVEHNSQSTRSVEHDLGLHWLNRTGRVAGKGMSWTGCDVTTPRISGQPRLGVRQSRQTWNPERGGGVERDDDGSWSLSTRCPQPSSFPFEVFSHKWD